MHLKRNFKPTTSYTYTHKLIRRQFNETSHKQPLGQFSHSHTHYYIHRVRPRKLIITELKSILNTFSLHTLSLSHYLSLPRIRTYIITIRRLEQQREEMCVQQRIIRRPLTKMKNQENLKLH